MKTAVIVYATGEPPPAWSEEKERSIRDLFPEADAVEIITLKTGHFDLHDAWFKLISKGMSLIVCKLAAFNDVGQVRLTGRELRLCG